MSRQLLPFLLFVGLASCRPSIPADVLPPEKMKAAMWDMMRADELATYYTDKDSSISASGKRAAYYDQVFRVQKITREDFRRSLRFYETHPTIFKMVLDSLQDQGERLQKQLDSHSRNLKGADSLRTRTPHATDSFPRKAPLKKRHVPA